MRRISLDTYSQDGNWEPLTKSQRELRSLMQNRPTPPTETKNLVRTKAGNLIVRVAR